MRKPLKSVTRKDVIYALQFGGERLLRTYVHDERTKGGGSIFLVQDRASRRSEHSQRPPVRSACAARRGRFVSRPFAAIRVEG